MSFVIAAFLNVLIWTGAAWLGWNLHGRPSSSEGRGDILASMWSGWILQAVFLLISGWFGFLNKTILFMLLLLPIGILFVDYARFSCWLIEALRPYRNLCQGSSFMRSLAAGLFLWIIYQATVSVFFYDTLFYGYGLPSLWLAEGRITPSSPDVFAFVAVPVRMHFMWGLALNGDTLVCLLNLTIFLFAALSVGRILFDIIKLPVPWPLIGICIVLSIPALWEDFLLRKDDLPVLWGSAVLCYLYFHFLNNLNPSPYSTWVLGLSMGSVLAAKQTGTPGFIFALGILGMFHRPSGNFRKIRFVLICGLALLIGLTPWIIHTWIGAGNPLAPLHPPWSHYDIPSQRWKNIYVDSDALFQAKKLSVEQALFLPLLNFYNPKGWSAAGFMGFLILFGLPLAFFSSMRLPFRTLWFLGFASFLFTFRLPRFSFFLLPLAVAIIVNYLARWVSIRRCGFLLFALSLLHVAIYLRHPVTGTALLSHGLIRVNPYPDITLYPPSIDVCRFANENLNRNRDRILFVGETQYYPCTIPFYFWNPYFMHPLEKVPSGQAPESWWRNWIEQEHFTYIVYTPTELRRLIPWSEKQITSFEIWLRQNTRMIYYKERGPAITYLLQWKSHP